MLDITVMLTEALEGALRRAGLNELEGGADDLSTAMMDPDTIDAAAVDEARARIAHAGLILDQLGYSEDERGESLTAPPAAVLTVAARALENLQAEIHEPGCVGHEHSPRGLRASADLWEELRDVIAMTERESAVAS